MSKNRVFCELLKVASLGVFLSSVSSCVPLAIGAAGVAGGYVLNEQGYRVQAPLTKTPKYEQPTYQAPAYQEPAYQPAPSVPQTYTVY